uniref:Protein arginine N-methyltransferase n=1 Tax=Bursaphelenchus xylophilus TaxID=6326 RepID=A0A1I7SU54_BURXY
MSLGTKVNPLWFDQSFFNSEWERFELGDTAQAAYLRHKGSDGSVKLLDENLLSRRCHSGFERFTGVTWYKGEKSINQIQEDFDNANYLGIGVVCVDVRSRPTKSFLKLLRKYLYLKTFIPYIIILLPSSDCVWDTWKDIREGLCNACYDKLGVGIHFVDKVSKEFNDAAALQRWKGEPVKLIAAGQSLLEKEKNQYLMAFLREYITPECEYFMCNLPKSSKECCADIENQMKNFEMMKDVLKNNCRKMPMINNTFIEDVPQRPLRPTEDNLTSSIYKTFEDNRSKYQIYEEAITEVILDWQKGCKFEKKKMVILLVGAGRGGLVESIMKALRKTDIVSDSIVVAVEKNPFAFRSLVHKNKKMWDYFIKLVNADLREHKLIKKALDGHVPYLVISELLGSFACNELSPDLLTTLEPLIDNKTVFLPQYYTNFISPCFSFRLNNIIQGGRPDFYQRLSNFCGRDGIRAIDSNNYSNLDQLYVSTLNSAYIIDAPQPVCTYKHHAKASNLMQWRSQTHFKISVDCQINGLAGFFEAKLKSNTISTVPKDINQFTDIKKSWFPAYFPLSYPLDCPKGSTVDVLIERKVNDQGMWYEWCVVVRRGRLVMGTDVQNKGGESYFVRFHEHNSDNDDSQLLSYVGRGYLVKENIAK